MFRSHHNLGAFALFLCLLGAASTILAENTHRASRPQNNPAFLRFCQEPLSAVFPENVFAPSTQRGRSTHSNFQSFSLRPRSPMAAFSRPIQPIQFNKKIFDVFSAYLTCPDESRLSKELEEQLEQDSLWIGGRNLGNAKEVKKLRILKSELKNIGDRNLDYSIRQISQFWRSGQYPPKEAFGFQYLNKKFQLMADKLKGKNVTTLDSLLKHLSADEQSLVKLLFTDVHQVGISLSDYLMGPLLKNYFKNILLHGSPPKRGHRYNWNPKDKYYVLGDLLKDKQFEPLAKSLDTLMNVHPASAEGLATQQLLKSQVEALDTEQHKWTPKAQHDLRRHFQQLLDHIDSGYVLAESSEDLMKRELLRSYLNSALSILDRPTHRTAITDSQKEDAKLREELEVERSLKDQENSSHQKPTGSKPHSTHFPDQYAREQRKEREHLRERPELVNPIDQIAAYAQRELDIKLGTEERGRLLDNLNPFALKLLGEMVQRERYYRDKTPDGAEKLDRAELLDIILVPEDKEKAIYRLATLSNLGKPSEEANRDDLIQFAEDQIGYLMPESLRNLPPASQRTPEQRKALSKWVEDRLLNHMPVTKRRADALALLATNYRAHDIPAAQVDAVTLGEQEHGALSLSHQLHERKKLRALAEESEDGRTAAETMESLRKELMQEGTDLPISAENNLLRLRSDYTDVISLLKKEMPKEDFRQLLQFIDHGTLEDAVRIYLPEIHHFYSQHSRERMRSHVIRDLVTNESDSKEAVERRDQLLRSLAIDFINSQFEEVTNPQAFLASCLNSKPDAKRHPFATEERCKLVLQNIYYDLMGLKAQAATTLLRQGEELPEQDPMRAKATESAKKLLSEYYQSERELDEVVELLQSNAARKQEAGLAAVDPTTGLPKPLEGLDLDLSETSRQRGLRLREIRAEHASELAALNREIADQVIGQHKEASQLKQLKQVLEQAQESCKEGQCETKLSEGSEVTKIKAERDKLKAKIDRRPDIGAYGAYLSGVHGKEDRKLKELNLKLELEEELEEKESLVQKVRHLEERIAKRKKEIRDFYINMASMGGYPTSRNDAELEVLEEKLRSIKPEKELWELYEKVAAQEEKVERELNPDRLAVMSFLSRQASSSVGPELGLVDHSNPDLLDRSLDQALTLGNEGQKQQLAGLIEKAKNGSLEINHDEAMELLDSLSLNNFDFSSKPTIEWLKKIRENINAAFPDDEYREKLRASLDEWISQGEADPSFLERMGKYNTKIEKAQRDQRESRAAFTLRKWLLRKADSLETRETQESNKNKLRKAITSEDDDEEIVQEAERHADEILRHLDKGRNLARALQTREGSPNPRSPDYQEQLDAWLAEPFAKKLYEEWLWSMTSGEQAIRLDENKAKEYFANTLYPEAYQRNQERHQAREDILKKLAPVLDWNQVEMDTSGVGTSFDWDNAQLHKVAPDQDSRLSASGGPTVPWTEKSLREAGYVMTASEFEDLLGQYGELTYTKHDKSAETASPLEQFHHRIRQLQKQNKYRDAALVFNPSSVVMSSLPERQSDEALQNGFLSVEDLRGEHTPERTAEAWSLANKLHAQIKDQSTFTNSVGRVGNALAAGTSKAVIEDPLGMLTTPISTVRNGIRSADHDEVTTQLDKEIEQNLNELMAYARKLSAAGNLEIEVDGKKITAAQASQQLLGKYKDLLTNQAEGFKLQEMQYDMMSEGIVVLAAIAAETAITAGANTAWRGPMIAAQIGKRLVQYKRLKTMLKAANSAAKKAYLLKKMGSLLKSSYAMAKVGLKMTPAGFGLMGAGQAVFGNYRSDNRKAAEIDDNNNNVPDYLEIPKGQEAAFHQKLKEKGLAHTDRNEDGIPDLYEGGLLHQARRMGEAHLPSFIEGYTMTKWSAITFSTQPWAAEAVLATGAHNLLKPVAGGHAELFAPMIGMGGAQFVQPYWSAPFTGEDPGTATDNAKSAIWSSFVMTPVDDIALAWAAQGKVPLGKLGNVKFPKVPLNNRSAYAIRLPINMAQDYGIGVAEWALEGGKYRLANGQEITNPWQAGVASVTEGLPMARVASSLESALDVFPKVLGHQLKTDSSFDINILRGQSDLDFVESGIRSTYGLRDLDQDTPAQREMLREIWGSQADNLGIDSSQLGNLYFRAREKASMLERRMMTIEEFLPRVKEEYMRREFLGAPQRSTTEIFDRARKEQNPRLYRQFTLGSDFHPVSPTRFSDPRMDAFIDQVARDYKLSPNEFRRYVIDSSGKLDGSTLEQLAKSLINEKRRVR